MNRLSRTVAALAAAWMAFALSACSADIDANGASAALRPIDDDPPDPPDPPQEEPPPVELPPDDPPPPPPPDPFPFPGGGNQIPGGGGAYDPGEEFPTVTTITVHNAQELVSALAGAQPNTVIDIPEGVSIDLTNINCGIKPIGVPDTAECAALQIPAGVTLHGGRGRLQEGALIFTTRMRDHGLFDVAGDSVRIEGLRFRGPSRGKEESLPEVIGVLIPDRFIASVVNNEMSDFTSAAVMIRGLENLTECVASTPSRPNLQQILNNYMHHNQRRQRGYGVVVHDGAFPLISGNTFDANRHSIAADGNTTTGYRAMNNLVLSGGGEYCDYGVGCWYEHLFDVHGTSGAPHYDGGFAGQHIDVGFNTFRGAQTYGVWPFEKTRAAFNVRGTPCDHHTFHDNVLLHGSIGAALRNNSTEDNVYDSANQFGIDASKNLLVGDLDGDGRDDLFMATGAAWYYSSGGLTDWRFLGRHPEQTASLRLGNFDNDARADVFHIAGDQWRYSSGGIGQWTNLAGGTIPLDELRFGDFNGDGKTDVFKANGSKWHVSWGGVSGWVELNVSGYGVDTLGFGDFDGNGTTDVFGIANGQWSVSWSGTTGWRKLRDMQYMNFGEAVFADVDGNGVTDVLYSKVTGGAGTSQSTISWYLSHDGYGTWSRIRNFQALGNDPSPQVRDHWLGSFDGVPGDDALRYTPPTGAGSSEGTMVVRWSHDDVYVAHSREGMR